MSLRVADEFVWTGVPAIHLINFPLPRVRNTAADRKEKLNFPLINHVNDILRVFVYEYLHISP